MRFLIIEDSVVDCKLLERHLRSAGLIFEFQQVGTRDEFIDAIQNQHWNLIFSDYHLPSFDPYNALEILNALQLDIPIIVVSGAIRDIEAASILKAGSVDFISKDDLSRLVPAIHRELREAEIRRERLALSQKLVMAKDSAELANQRKSRVLAFVAHEFKNPLRSIELFSDLLLQNKAHVLHPEQAEQIQAIAEACQHIRRIVDDINDVSPIESGQFSLRYESLLLRPLCEEVRTLMLPAAQKRRIAIDIEMTDLYLQAEADKQRLRQILINLVSNAIKYTDAGDNVIMKVGQNGDNLFLQVIDHGPGIPPEELDNLFADFYRVKNSFSTQVEGLGLGLALTKSLAERHGGTIRVISEIGQGTTFEVSIPQRSASFPFETLFNAKPDSLRPVNYLRLWKNVGPANGVLKRLQVNS